ncbi:ATP-binding protein [Massilia sp. DWR3-1-1]|uniref:sensor histidine kinase n=1 Tax=Massilia sp. DWR3-1-1 TaxID=2804559 RepID=UPI003CF95A1B
MSDAALPRPRLPWRATFHSLRWRLMLLVALSLMPLVAMTIAVGVRERATAISTARDNLQRLVNLAAANEAQSIESAMQILRDLSSVPTVVEHRAECPAVLADILQKNRDYVNFGLIAISGEVVCSAVPALVPVNLGDRAHFRRAVAERRFIAGNYVFGRVVQKHTVNLTLPVIKGDQVVGVLFAALDLVELDKFVDSVQLPANAVLWTLDEEGTVISHRPAAAGMLGKKIPLPASRATRTDGAPLSVLDADGIKRLYASSKVGPLILSNYTVLIGVPEAAVLDAVWRDQLLLLGGLLATLALAAVVAWWVGDVLIVKRVRLIAATADRIASGELATRTGMRHGGEEIGELAHALDRMAASLEQRSAERDAVAARLLTADQRKDEFLALLGHELRNPLSPIITGARLLTMQASDPVAVTRTAAMIGRQADHMSRLVDDLLDVSRVARGLIEIARAPLDLRGVVEQACEQITPQCAARQQRLEVHLPPAPCMVEGDHKRLVQVVGNLLGNASRYTAQDGHLALRLASAEGRVLLTVSDDGIGMAPELVPQVFDLHTQAVRTADRSHGGLGLGLALVKNLVQLHGGLVKADSAGPGQGSTFTVVLPELARPR